MKYVLVAIGIIAVIGLLVFVAKYSPASKPTERVYVAVEGEGKIAVVDPQNQKILRSIDLSTEHDGGKLPFSPHNVQVSPDGKTVWVTANAGKHQEHSLNIVPPVLAHGEETEAEEKDEVIIIDPKLDLVIKRISVAGGAHLAHVVLTPDSTTAYVTAQNKDAVYKINARDFQVSEKISLPAKSQAHGLRVSPDGKTVYIAMMNKTLGVLDLITSQVSFVPLEGAGVQAGVTPDGKWVMVSLYDTKRLALVDPQTRQIAYVTLPHSARGPIQMYPTPDSRFVYLADQGHYFDQPEGSMIYKVELTSQKVVKEIKGGRGPHGVVISPDGKFVYVTNLLSGDLTIVNTQTDAQVATISVGKEPNGVSVWTEGHGTP